MINRSHRTAILGLGLGLVCLVWQLARKVGKYFGDKCRCRCRRWPASIISKQASNLIWVGFWPALARPFVRLAFPTSSLVITHNPQPTPQLLSVSLPAALQMRGAQPSTANQDQSPQTPTREGALLRVRCEIEQRRRLGSTHAPDFSERSRVMAMASLRAASGPPSRLRGLAAENSNAH